MPKYLFLYILLITSWTALAQEYPRQELDIENFIDELYPLQEEADSYEDMYENLLQYYRSPLNLNKASRQELQSLYILSELQLNNFFEYKERFGSLVTIYELQAIPGFDLNTIYKLTPFVKVLQNNLMIDNRSLWQRIKEEENNYLLLRYQKVLEQKKGYTKADSIHLGKMSNRYTGSPHDIYIRYRLQRTNDFSIGLTLQKDAGEQVTWNPKSSQYLSDYISAHIMLENRGRLKSFVLGDYQLQLGQGLVLSSGFAIGKGSETVTTVRGNSLGIRPYTSVLENSAFRGVAATYQLDKLLITGFYSNKNIDGEVSDNFSDTLSHPDFKITSLSTTGYHRTPSEIANKHTIKEQIAGSALIYNCPDKRFQMGITAVGTQFNKPYIRDSRIYNQYEFRGNQNLVNSIFYSYGWQNISLFGEGARSLSGGTGIVTGLLASLTSKTEFSFLFRSYDKNFHSFYSAAFGEATRNINETGAYWGIKIQPAQKWIFSAYYDLFKYPWLAYRTYGPSYGQEWLARISYSPNKSVNIYAQLRSESKERNSDKLTDKAYQLQLGKRYNYLFNIDYKASSAYSFKSRVQFSSYTQQLPTTFGYAIIQDASWNTKWVSLSGRVALFDTEGSYNRQYTYERDVLYSFSLPAYSGRGLRTYFMLHFNVGNKTDCWIRLARTSYRNQTVIGSGLEEINGNKKTELKIQVRRKF